MKFSKFLIVVLVLSLLPISFASAHSTVDGQTEAKTNLIFVAGINTQNSFKSIDGGVGFGMDYKPDDKFPIWLRAIYSQFKFGSDIDKIKSIKTLAYLEYFLGKKWDINLIVGADNYTGGGLSGTDGFVGIGGKRRIWTFTGNNTLIPATLSFIGEITFVDVEEDSYNNAMQINIGFSFNPGIK